MTTGWLLGLVQDKTVTTDSGTTHEHLIVNPGFRKDVKEPVGQFEGDLTFDLYASDNGTIKETQSYVLEIETPQGTVVSKPIKYKQPMTSGETPAPSPSPVTSPAPVPSPTPVPTPTPVPAPAQGSQDLEIRVFFKGTELHFDEMAPVLKDGRTLVPFRQLFETLGFTVDWVEEGNVRKAIGKKDGQSIELTIDSTTAMVNGKAVALDVPAQIMGAEPWFRCDSYRKTAATRSGSPAAARCGRSTLKRRILDHRFQRRLRLQPRRPFPR
ncbi:copper amine oxidase N-terminal domain-containing protein [Paenibacillus sp. CC-CFT747]|nr:copper amine oxidase N-terminal domain-containing protein [Paenibacillus sp. CC-CFT747]